MKKVLEYVTFLAVAALAMPAGAVTWSTDVDTVGACTGSTSSCSLTDTSGGGTLKFRAYSNSAWTGGSIAPIGLNTTGIGTAGTGWVTANNNYYGTTSGYGIKNLVQQGSTEENISPEHATDNKEVLDVMVIELPNTAGQAWDLTSFMLGWAQENASGTSADVSMFIGGAGLGADYNFAGVCIDNSGVAGVTCGSQTKLSTLGGGFTNISSLISGGNSNIQQGVTTNVDSTAVGNYIIMTGRLGDGDDAFKLRAISATGGITTKNPLPGTLPLLGLGLFGLLANRRRAAAQA